jgi:sulfur carrier protein ThiS
MAMSRTGDRTADAPAITVSVTFFADLRRYLPKGADGPQRYAVPAGATVADLIAAIGIEATYDITVAVDGELADRETKLRQGADVMLLSPMEGGASRA